MSLCRQIRFTGKNMFASGALISVRFAKGFEIGERVEIRSSDGRKHLAFAIVIRDMSNDPAYESTPYTDPRSSRKLPNYNSAQFFWELRVE
jgi:hypothetical protein